MFIFKKNINVINSYLSDKTPNFFLYKTLRNGISPPQKSNYSIINARKKSLFEPLFLFHAYMTLA